MLRRSAIRSLVEDFGPAGYLKIQALLLGMTESGQIPEGPDGKPVLSEQVTLPNGRQVPRKNAHEFSFLALWEGLVGPVEETMGFAQQGFGYIEHPIGLLEAEGVGAVASSAFPSAVGQLIAIRVIEGYDAPGFVGDELVTPMPSRLRGERVVGFTSLQGPKPVGEGDEYQGSTFREKYVTTTETKRGRLISLTEEAVFHDQTGQILQRASQMGRKAREDRERRIIRGVADVASTERVYRPSGTAEQLYASGNNNIISTATVLTDWTDIQEVFAWHAANVTDDRETDDVQGGQPIVWMPTHLLTARELAGVAARIFAATISTSGSVEAPQAAILAALGAGGIKPVSSPFLDAAQGEDQFDDASDWFLGDFPGQFIYKTIWPLQTFRAPTMADAQFRRDIVAEYKVREYGDVNAIDEKLVIKINAAS